MSFAQSKKTTVSYYSSDSLRITADIYFTADSLPYIILLHEQGSSRGEFVPIIDRFQKMNFNCLAVDVRNGGSSNFVSNETAKRCRNHGATCSFNEIEEDIIASIDYLYAKDSMDVILLGSGANASTAVTVAMRHPFVKGVIALSPGEFYKPMISIEDRIKDLTIPVLVTSGKIEFPYVQQMVKDADDNLIKIFAPENSEGARGTKALYPDTPSSGDYWLNVLLFIKDLN